MALGLFKKRKEEEGIGKEFGPMPPPPAVPEFPEPFETRDLTGASPFPPPKQSTETLDEMEAFEMKPAAPLAAPAEMPPAPRYRPSVPVLSPRPATGEIEAIAEAIIAERWQKVSREIDELKRAQEDISATVGGMQERMSNLEKKMDMVIQEVLGKVEEYGRGISDVSTELKAMQKVFGTVLPTFTEDIKDLHELVGETKQKGIKVKKRRKKKK